MPLDGMARTAHPRRGAAVQHPARDRRPEPALRDGGGDDERRRVRPRLVRRGRRPGALPQRRAGLGGREPAGARRPRRVAAVPRPRPRRDRLARAADELPPVPPPQLALRPQRLRGRPARAPARPDARHRPRALRRRQRLDRHRGRLPARAHARARGGPDRRDGADRRPHRGDRPRPRAVRPRPGHVRHLERRHAVGHPLRDRGHRAHAVRVVRRRRDPPAVSRQREAEPPRPGRPADRLRAVRRPAGRLARDPAVERGDRTLRG